MLTPVTPPAAAVDSVDRYRRRPLLSPDVMGKYRPTQPPRLVARVLGTGQLPNNLVGVLLEWFQVTDADGASLPIELRKGGWIHAFLGRLTAEADPVPGLAGITLLGVDRNGGAHILHSSFSVPVRPYKPDLRLFGCCGELPLEGVPTITEVPVDSFAARRVVSAMLREDHIVHLEGFLPSSWRKNLCERASIKAEGRNLT